MKVKNVKVSLPVFFTEEDGMVSAHTPALDIATCGKNEEEARKNFHDLVETFLEELLKMGTIEQVFLECGWKKIEQTKTWQPPKIKSDSEEIIFLCPA